MVGVEWQFLICFLASQHWSAAFQPFLKFTLRSKERWKWWCVFCLRRCYCPKTGNTFLTILQNNLFAPCHASDGCKLVFVPSCKQTYLFWIYSILGLVGCPTTVVLRNENFLQTPFYALLPRFSAWLATFYLLIIFRDAFSGLVMWCNQLSVLQNASYKLPGYSERPRTAQISQGAHCQGSTVRPEGKGIF